MSALLKATLMLLGAACVLLFAGAFPLTGAPAVYKSGPMLILGAAVGVLSLWGAWRISGGAWLRLAGGMLGAFLACDGVVAIGEFGAMSLSYARQGGPMWFGCIAMACTAAVGALFCVIFGWLALRMMDRRLWLAALHVCGALLLAAAFVDMSCETTQTLRLPVGEEFRGAGFSLRVQDFQVTHYPDDGAYALLRHTNGRWMPQGSVYEKDGAVTIDGRRMELADMRRATEGGREFLYMPGDQPVLLAKAMPAVREYRADCLLTVLRKGEPEQRQEILRVNEPITCAGHVIYLMSYSSAERAAKPTVTLLIRRAPGRWLALASMIGIIISTACWCFYPPERRAAA